MAEQTYEQWMQEVDNIITTRFGISVHCLSDFMSRDLYDGGSPPIDGAWEALDRSDMRELADSLYEEQ